MNTRRVFAPVIGACIAALLTAGCSAQPPDPNSISSSDTSELPAFSETAPAGYDRWEEVYGGPADLPEMKSMAKYFGLDSIDVPSDKSADDYVGVSLLEAYCVVGFNSTVERATEGIMDVMIMSRYNESYYIVLPSLPPKNVQPMLNKYRPLCRGELELSDMTDNGSAKA